MGEIVFEKPKGHGGTRKRKSDCSEPAKEGFHKQGGYKRFRKNLNEKSVVESLF